MPKVTRQQNDENRKHRVESYRQCVFSRNREIIAGPLPLMRGMTLC